MTELLLLSNSTIHGSSYLEHAMAEIADFLGGVSKLLFIPYARFDESAYTRRVTDVLSPLGIKVRGLHTQADPRAVISDADAIFTGGGNTFKLLKALQEQQLLETLRSTLTTGTRYMSASAGTNLAGPTIRTTNDMPIVEVRSFAALGLVPFQINPHFVDADPASTHRGETRETRLAEYAQANTVPVLALREGTHLRVSLGPSHRFARIGGTAVGATLGPAKLFLTGQEPREVSGDVSELLEVCGRFDVREANSN